MSEDEAYEIMVAEFGPVIPRHSFFFQKKGNHMLVSIGYYYKQLPPENAIQEFIRIIKDNDNDKDMHLEDVAFGDISPLVYDLSIVHNTDGKMQIDWISKYPSYPNQTYDFYLKNRKWILSEYSYDNGINKIARDLIGPLLPDSDDLSIIQYASRAGFPSKPEVVYNSDSEIWVAYPEDKYTDSVFTRCIVIPESGLVSIEVIGISENIARKCDYKLSVKQDGSVFCHLLKEYVPLWMEEVLYSEDLFITPYLSESTILDMSPPDSLKPLYVGDRVFVDSRRNYYIRLDLGWFVLHKHTMENGKLPEDIMMEISLAKSII